MPLYIHKRGNSSHSSILFLSVFTKTRFYYVLSYESFSHSLCHFSLYFCFILLNILWILVLNSLILLSLIGLLPSYFVILCFYFMWAKYEIKENAEVISHGSVINLVFGWEMYCTGSDWHTSIYMYTHLNVGMGKYMHINK